MNTAFKLKAHNSYKVGVEEVAGLAAMLEKLLKPVQHHIKEHAYWNDCAIEATEYKSRDGFIPYSHNCGGREISIIIPKCEEYDFSYLEFGECNDCGEKQCGIHGDYCGAEADGHLDAKLRVWLKYEGKQDDGSHQFYLYAGGGNGDAPYFRTRAEATIFEREFSVRTMKQLEREGQKAVKALLKVLK